MFIRAHPHMSTGMRQEAAIVEPPKPATFTAHTTSGVDGGVWTEGEAGTWKRSPVGVFKTVAFSICLSQRLIIKCIF